MKKKMINPPFYLNLTILLMVGAHFLFPIQKIIQDYLKLVGIIPLAIGIALNLIADKQFKKHKTTVKPGKESEKLVTDGVFNFSRNPMYLGMILIQFGFFFFLGSVSSLLLIPLFIYFVNSRYINLEENMLELKFEEEWRNYKKSVNKWI